MTQGVMVRRPTVGVRRGLRLILDRLMDDFDNGFERIFPSANDRAIMDIMEVADWMDQYATEEAADWMDQYATEEADLEP